LAREGQDTARWNLLHPDQPPRQSYVETCLSRRASGTRGGRHRLHEDVRRTIASLHTAHYLVLGTDGYGRSDTRAKLRQHFEVDRYYVTVATALKHWPRKGENSRRQGARSHAKIRHRPRKAEPADGIRENPGEHH
jgi:pyruvate dehydrogenase E1 component